MEISNDTLNAIDSVYQTIGYDLPDDIDNEDVIEICLDADRLTTFGYPEAQTEVKDLIDQHGYMETLEFISTNLVLV